MTSRFFRSACAGLLMYFAFTLTASLVTSEPALAQTKPATAVCTTGDMSCIKHIVFIMKENRSYDVYFGAYQPPAGSGQTANGSTTPHLSNGTVINAPHLYDSSPLDICHDWKCNL